MSRVNRRIRPTATGLATALTVTMALSACSADTPPPTPAPTTGPILPESPESPSAATQPAAPAPTTTATPTQPTASAPALPAAARRRTAPGAEAHVRHFIASYNTSATTGTAGVLPSLSTTACKSCQALETDLRKHARAGNHYERAPLTFTLVGGMDGLPESDPDYPVLARIREHSNRILNDRGQPIEETKGSMTDLIFTLVWRRDSWRVNKIWIRRDVE